MIQQRMKYEAPMLEEFDLDLMCVKGDLGSEPGIPEDGGFGEADEPPLEP